MKSILLQASLRWSLGLEEIVNGRQVATLTLDDPVLAAYGGACAMKYEPRAAEHVKRYLETHDGKTADEQQTNNPSLLKDLHKLATLQAPTFLIMMSTELRSRLTQEQYEAVMEHERGHVHHGHNEEAPDGTHEQFIRREKEADAYAASKTSAQAMIEGLEIALKFGAEQQTLWASGMTSPFIRKLYEQDAIDRKTLKQVLIQNRAAHIERFHELQRLIKEKNKAA
jgi:hypothetical protein